VNLTMLAPSPFLPPLLRFDNGTIITAPHEWAARRAELWRSLQHNLLGTVPTHRPTLTDAAVLNRTTDGSTVSTFVALSFHVPADGCASGTEATGTAPRDYVDFSIELLSTATTSAKQPVFMTQWNHRGWAVAAAARGFFAVVYPAADVQDAAPALQAAYPQCTFALIAARAFVASITLDYVLTLPDADATRVSLSGHSRNGKQSLIAAAYDSRFAAVVGSSPGAPISTPYRFSSSNFYGEGPRTGGVAGKWWLHSTLQYDGRPELMPIDGHAILGLIAPRRVMVATGRQDFESDMVFGNEQAVVAAVPAFRLLGASTALGMDNPRLLLRPGGHHGFDDIES